MLTQNGCQFVQREAAGLCLCLLLLWIIMSLCVITLYGRFVRQCRWNPSVTQLSGISGVDPIISLSLYCCFGCKLKRSLIKLMPLFYSEKLFHGCSRRIYFLFPRTEHIVSPVEFRLGELDWTSDSVLVPVFWSCWEKQVCSSVQIQLKDDFRGLSIMWEMFLSPDFYSAVTTLFVACWFCFLSF